MAATSTTPAISAETTTADMSPVTAAPVDTTCWFMEIPLELRYKIFELVAARDKAPEHVFPHWFEKRDVDQQIAAHVAADPTGVAPVGKYTRFKIEVEPETDDAVVGDDGGEHGDDDEEEDEDDDENDEDEEDEEMDEDIGEDIDEDMNEEEESQDVDGDMVGDGSNMTSTAATVTPPVLSTPVVAVSPGDEFGGEGENQEQEHEDREEDMSEADSDNHDNHDNHDSHDDPVDADGHDTIAPPAPPAPQAPPRPRVIEPAPKWRHIPKFMSISHCPPPTEVLLASKELNKQAMDWFYEAAVLHIKGTASFAHPTFFEEAFQQLFDAAFSPMENIRKAEITLVWDTAWIRASDERDLYEAILPAFLRQRTAFIVKTLKRAPMLKDLVIHWHDSLKDDDSEALKYDVLADFYNIPATNINVEEHFIAPDAKPLRKSKAGKFRVELMDIAERGVECLYQS